jgi:hypothetical protein
VGLLRRYAGAVHKDDLSGAGLLPQEGRFQPVLVHGAGGVGDAAFIDLGDPRGVAADMHVQFSHVPFVALARCMQALDVSHDGVSIKSRASIEYIKGRCNHGVELRHIVFAGCTEDGAHSAYDLSLLEGEGFLPSSCSRNVRKYGECDCNNDKANAES